MYPGAQQEFQTKRLIPVCFCTVIGQWFIHPQGSMVSKMMPNTTFPKGKIFMANALLCLMVVSMLQWRLGSVQRLYRVLSSMTWPSTSKDDTMKMNFLIFFSTQEKRKGYTVAEIETIYGMRCALEAQTLRHLPG